MFHFFFGIFILFILAELPSVGFYYGSRSFTAHSQKGHSQLKIQPLEAQSQNTHNPKINEGVAENVYILIHQFCSFNWCKGLRFVIFRIDKCFCNFMIIKCFNAIDLSFNFFRIFILFIFSELPSVRYYQNYAKCVVYVTAIISILPLNSNTKLEFKFFKNSRRTNYLFAIYQTSQILILINQQIFKLYRI